MLEGCATFAAHGKTSQGVEWHGPPSLGKDVDRMVDLTAHAFEKATKHKVDKARLNGVQVFITEERPPCINKRGDCHGVLVARVIYLKAEYCIPYTSLAHELIHLFARWAVGYYDTDHDDPRFFRTPNSAEFRAAHAGIHEGMCE